MRTIRTVQICTAASLALAAAAVTAQPAGNDKDHGKQTNSAKTETHGEKKTGSSKSSSAAQPQAQSKANSQAKRSEPSQAQSSSKSQSKSSAKSTSNHNSQSQTPSKTPSGHEAAGQNEKKSQTSSHTQQAQQKNSAKTNAGARKDERQASVKPQGKDSNAGNASKGSNGGNGNKGQATLAQRPQRADIKKVSFTNTKGKKFEVPSNDRVRVVTKPRDIDWTKLKKTKTFDGCPPGLAKKYNDCTPPGLDQPAKKNWAQPTWYGRDYDSSARYRYTDGYMLQLGSGSQVVGYIPMLAGALSVGKTWPGNYQSVAIPSYYDSYYDLGSSGSYRYYGDTIYRVDPDTSAIQSVAALLTGNDIVIGNTMPAGYEVYNVPYAYRDQYVDGSDALYRYSDGYIYQLDPTTRLVQAAIELLTA